MPTRAPSMLLDIMRVGPNTYMGVSRAGDEAMAEAEYDGVHVLKAGWVAHERAR